MQAMLMNVISNLDAVKRQLKTYLFTAAFSGLIELYLPGSPLMIVFVILALYFWTIGAG